MSHKRPRKNNGRKNDPLLSVCSWAIAQSRHMLELQPKWQRNTTPRHWAQADLLFWRTTWQDGLTRRTPPTHPPPSPAPSTPTAPRNSKTHTAQTKHPRAGGGHGQAWPGGENAYDKGAPAKGPPWRCKHSGQDARLVESHRPAPLRPWAGSVRHAGDPKNALPPTHPGVNPSGGNARRQQDGKRRHWPKSPEENVSVM